jgi:His/Glu/Gln/Arg/opine family amino acid ABC transporter permease subunit
VPSCIVIVGLAVAAARTVQGPVFAPLRLLAAAYTDLFRGVPLIVLLYIVGFGLPGLRLSGTPSNEAVLGGIALVLTYSAYVAEVFRAGIESVHPSQRMAARSLGLSYGQTMRRVVLPQAVRRVMPPLLNDLVALQKDVGLISVLGAVDAVRAAEIAKSRPPTSRRTSSPASSSSSSRSHGPPRRLGELARDPTPPGRGAGVTAVLAVRGARQALRRDDGARPRRPRRRRARGGGADRRVGVREVDAAAVREPARRARRRHGAARRRGHHRPRVDADAVRARFGVVFQAYNLFPHLTVLDNVTLASRVVRRQPRAAAEERAMALLTRVGSRTRRRSTPTGSRAASSSGPRSSARSPASRGCCCSTRSPAPWTPSSSARCSRSYASSRVRA